MENIQEIENIQQVENIPAVIELDEDEVATEDLFDHIPGDSGMNWRIVRESVILG